VSCHPHHTIVTSTFTHSRNIVSLPINLQKTEHPGRLAVSAEAEATRCMDCFFFAVFPEDMLI
jgi:hypothetical protein